MFLGKASTAGALERSHAQGLAQRAAALKAELKAKTRRSNFAALAFAAGVGSLAIVTHNTFFAILAIVAAAITYSAIASDYDSWLQEG